MLKLLNVSYRYNGGNGSGGVEGVTLEVQTGEFILLVGKTGAGKTTLIRLLTLELLPESGEMSLEQLQSSRLKRSQFPVWRRRLGVVFQDIRLLKERTTLENVRLTAYCERSLPGSPKARALRVLANVGLTHKLHSPAGELSTGEQQRAAIGRALVNQPLILLADEPVSNLDGETSSHIVDLLVKANRSGTAVLVATHQPERFERCKPRLLRMEQGRLMET